MKRILITAIFILALVMTGCSGSDEEAYAPPEYHENQIITAAYDKGLAAECTNGIFVGQEDDGIISYKGIPYAKQPVGDLRWKAPQYPADSSKVYEAYYYGKAPIQTEWPSETGSYYEQGEDCLYLNVWTADNDLRNKPVMVFLHGGSYGWGGTTDPLYDGQNFIEEHDDVILITVGYRTGIMGYMDFDSVKGGDQFKESGNLGTLDQVAALKWISKNITAFGGDPDNVTVFGESAGGGTVSLLPLIDEADGLFHRIIAESGSIALTYSTEECQRLTEMLLDESGAQDMNDLMALTEEELKEINVNLNDYNNFPERDGIVIPKDLYAAYENGESADIDMIIGTNADETRYWIHEMALTVPALPGEFTYSLLMPLMFDSNMKQLSDGDKYYVDTFMADQGGENTWSISEFYNEILFRVPAIAMADAHSRNGGSVYMYYWEYPSAIGKMGACHAVELAYVFNNLDETIYTGNNIDEDLAAEVQEMWVNFAKTGDPSTEENDWRNYTYDDPDTIILDDDIHMREELLHEQKDLIKPLLDYGFNGCYTNLDLATLAMFRIVIVALSCIVILGWIVLTVVRRFKGLRAKKAE